MPGCGRLKTGNSRLMCVDMKNMKLAAAIMAGGRSSRMAGRHKGMLMTPDGVTFTDRLAAEMHKLTDLVYISYGEKIQTEAEACRIVQDIYPDCGPVGGLHAVLCRASWDGAAAVCVCACDMPYVTAELYSYLYTQLAKRTDMSENEHNPFGVYDGAVAVVSEKIHPLAAVYSAEAARIFKMQLKERNLRVRDALAKLRILYVDLRGTVYERMLVNINTEDDYAEYIDCETQISTDAHKLQKKGR